MMNDNKLDEMIRYFDENLAGCKARERRLRAEQRQDEAVFEKIRGNVFDVFKTILTVARRKEQDEDSIRRFFRQRLEQIPQGWVESLQKAEAHGDTEKAYIERIKLETVAAIRAQTEKLWEVSA